MVWYSILQYIVQYSHQPTTPLIDTRPSKVLGPPKLVTALSAPVPNSRTEKHIHHTSGHAIMCSCSSADARTHAPVDQWNLDPPSVSASLCTALPVRYIPFMRDMTYLTGRSGKRLCDTKVQLPSHSTMQCTHGVRTCSHSQCHDASHRKGRAYT